MVDLKTAEQRNFFFVDHWHDGLTLPILGVDLGDLIAYNLLDVLGRLWLQHAAEQAAAAQAAAQAPASVNTPAPATAESLVATATALGAAVGLSTQEVLAALEAAQAARVAAAGGATGEPQAVAGGTDTPQEPEGASTGLVADGTEGIDTSGWQGHAAKSGHTAQWGDQEGA